MRMRALCFLISSALVIPLTASPGLAEEGKGDPKDREAIAKAAEAFVEAFHKGDPRAVAAFWTEDGDYTVLTGHRLKGRRAIEKAFTERFSEHKGLKLRITGESLRFVTSDVAIEDGVTEVFTADGAPPSRSRFTNVLVRKDGQWQLSSVRSAVYVPPSNHEHLVALDWTVGHWASDVDRGQVERLSVNWGPNENFLIATFSATFGDVAVGSATQWIGWDPLTKGVRSWIFDAAGGFGEGSWSRDGKKWTIKIASVHQDGKKATATYVVTLIDADTLSLQARDRTLEGKQLPDMKEVRLKRVK
jgi:uncharacterized protein (TIGR02246 family)